VLAVAAEDQMAVAAVLAVVWVYMGKAQMAAPTVAGALTVKAVA
jgi:hypothetical protein